MVDPGTVIPFEKIAKDWTRGACEKKAVLELVWEHLPGAVYVVAIDLDGGEYEPDDPDSPELIHFCDCYWLIRTPRHRSKLADYAILTDDEVKQLTLVEATA